MAPFIVVAVATTLRAMGDISNAQRLNDPDWVRPGFRSMAGGVASNGIASAFCGLVGTTGVNSYSACVGLSGATGITSRVVGYACGSIFVLLAFVPAVAVAFATMPVPVMGAALFFSSAFVFTAGLQMMTARMLDARKSIVIGLSFGLAVMADVYHDVFTAVPAALQPIFGSSLVLGTVCAVLLNLVTRIGIRQRVVLRLEPGRLDREGVEGFFSEQGARWGARRDIISRATFAAVQVLEVLGDPPAGVEIEASFDEFDLDVRIRYVGTPLLLPEQKPTPREIMASDDGERLLAGYLLRRTADRSAVSAVDGPGRDPPALRSLSAAGRVPAQGEHGHVVRLSGIAREAVDVGLDSGDHVGGRVAARTAQRAFDARLGIERLVRVRGIRDAVAAKEQRIARLELDRVRVIDEGRPDAERRLAASRGCDRRPRTRSTRRAPDAPR